MNVNSQWLKGSSQSLRTPRKRKEFRYLRNQAYSGRSFCRSMNGFVYRDHVITKVLRSQDHRLTPSEAVLSQEHHLCLILPKFHRFKFFDREEWPRNRVRFGYGDLKDLRVIKNP